MTDKEIILNALKILSDQTQDQTEKLKKLLADHVRDNYMGEWVSLNRGEK